MRGIAAPLSLAGQRIRRRPGRWLAPAGGIALAAAFAVSVAAAGTIAGDRGARASLAGLRPLDRTVRITWQGLLTPGVADRARAMLGRLGVGAQTEVLLLNPVRLDGIIVRPAAIAPLSRWLPVAAVSGPGRCRAERCPMLLAGSGHLPRRLSAVGVRIDVFGAAPLGSAVPLGFAPRAGGQPPVLVTADVAGLSSLPGLSGVYRTQSWAAAPPIAGLHSWQLAALESRLERAQADLQTSGSAFSLTAPFAGLDAARAQAAAAPRRLLLAAGGAIAALALFVVLAGARLRREQLEELARLSRAGARTEQSALLVAAESSVISALAIGLGGCLGVAGAAVLAHIEGEPVGAILSHSLLTPVAGAVLAGGWLAATAALTLPVFMRSARTADVLALGALGALVAGVALGTGANGTLAALLAPLCCLAAGVLVFRAGAVVLRLGERVARGGPVLVRLALVGLGRDPGLPSLAIALVAVSGGLGGFALAYRATLARGAADQAADRVPLDALVAPGPDFATPLALAPRAQWRALAGGSVLPVRRTEANYLSGAGTVTVPALGVPAGGLAQIHGWRTSDGSAPLAVLADRLRPRGPVRVAGPLLPPPARSLSLRASTSAVGIAITADLRDRSGAITQVPLGTAGTRPSLLRARLPRGQWELEALELDEPTGLAITNGHQNGENIAASTQQRVRAALGPLMAADGAGKSLDTPLLGAWRAVGAASRAALRPRARTLSIEFATSGLPGIVRPQQPSDTQRLPVLVDQQTAAAAGHGGAISLTLDGQPVLARVVGTLRRYPTLPADAGGFVIADEASLSAALDAQLPGQGRPDELWLSAPRSEALRQALRRHPLDQLSASFRSDLQRGLGSAPIARGVQGTLLAAAVLWFLLAALGLLTALSTGAGDRTVTRDLEAQGIGPRGLRAELAVRLAIAGALGICAGWAIAIVLTRLAVAAVRAAGATATPRPPLVTVIPWLQLVGWGLVAIGALVLAAWLLARQAIGAGRRREAVAAPAAEDGRTLGEGALR